MNKKNTDLLEYSSKNSTITTDSYLQSLVET